ncbi:hypothetical protein RJ55_05301 [Drechmeria coniospora]|nr:hypothetical protein RJ55_05301 [Drechmeria coniospora]
MDPTDSAVKNAADRADAARRRSRSCVTELEILLDRFEARIGWQSQASGLSAWLREAKKTQGCLEHLVDELSTASPTDAAALESIGTRLDARSVDASHAETHWDILKRCRSLVAVNRSFQGSTRDDRNEHISNMAVRGRERQVLHRAMKEQGKVDVDVVEAGSEWLDIKTLHTDRLLRQMTDSGWAWGDHEIGDPVDAQENRHEYRIPRVRVVLPNIARGIKDIDVLLHRLCHLDPAVHVIIEDQRGHFLGTAAPVVDEAIVNLLGPEFDSLTASLNLDHTILIDLSSDITHRRLEAQKWQPETTRLQIEEEARHDGFMVKTLYPALDGRTLVCTKEAAEHFHTILDTVGTSTERARGRLLVPVDEETRKLSQADIRSRFQRLSIHHLPPAVQIPIRILDEGWDWESVNRAVLQKRLPRVALDVARCGRLKSSKLSIYMHGWASGMTTITSNKEVRGQIRTWLEKNRRHHSDCGPRIWSIGVTRNLLAKSATPPAGV